MKVKLKSDNNVHIYPQNVAEKLALDLLTDKGSCDSCGNPPIIIHSDEKKKEKKNQ